MKNRIPIIWFVERHGACAAARTRSITSDGTDFA